MTLFIPKTVGRIPGLEGRGQQHAYEQRANSVSDLQDGYWFDAAMKADGQRPWIMRDRVSRTLAQVVGADAVSPATPVTMGAINNRPALVMAETGYVQLRYKIPASFFIAVLREKIALANSGLLLGSDNLGSNRLALWDTSGDGLRGDFSATTTGANAQIAAIPVGVGVAWMSFDAETGEIEMGYNSINSLLPDGTKLVGAHKQSAISHAFGSPTATYGFTGKGSMAMIVPRHLSGALERERRGALVEELAYEGGILGSLV